MKNILFFVIVLLSFSFNLFSQNKNHDSICEDAIYVKTDDYEGVIFGPKCLKRLLIKDGDTIDEPRWIPTMQDIENAEKLIRKYVTKKSKHYLVNQGDGCPIIYQNFDKYVRQYYGTYNKKGQKILEVNFLWREYAYETEWKCVRLMIFDGCSFYWDISVNMNKKKCFDYWVNGIG
ncbi:MAG TPA: hypothetical protein PLQ91_01225 [Bacteroidales bacterium]|nr:hypothetical protein [Bacteroidales bacterium]